MGPVKATSICVGKYANFSGRAGRAEFWWFGLIYLAGAFATFWILEWIFRGAGLISAKGMLIYLALFVIPFLAVSWRRFHDFGRSGIPTLLPFGVLIFGITFSLVEGAFIPSDWPGLLGAFIGFGGLLIVGCGVLFLLLFPSTSGPNKFGPDPKEVTT